MNTLERYLVRQTMAAAVISLVVLLVVVVALFFTELLGDAAGGSVPGRMVLVLVALRVPEALVLVMPLALMTGLLLSLGAMGQNSELSVMRAVGLAPGRLFAAGARVATIWAVVMLVVTGWLSPLAERGAERVLADAARTAVIAGIQPGQFVSLADGSIVVYASGVDARTGRLRDVFISRDTGNGTEVTTARNGSFRVDDETGERFLTLFEGGQVVQAPSGGMVRRLQFARNDIRLPSVSRRGEGAGLATVLLPDLVAASSRAAGVELQWRLAPPLAVLLLAALAVPLAVVDPRQGRHGRIVLALVIYLGYSNAVHLCLMAMQQGRLAGAVGLWPIHGLVAMVAVGLWGRLYRRW